MGALHQIQRTRLCGFQSVIYVRLIYEMQSSTRQLTCASALAHTRARGGGGAEHALLLVARSLTWAHLTSHRRYLRDQETTATGNRKKKKRTALNQIGTRIRVNEMEVTLFRMGSIVFATQEACKHMGGPLSLGDIEVRLDLHTLSRQLRSRVQ